MIQDDEVGFSPNKKNGFRIFIIDGFAKPSKGSFEMENNNGTKSTLRPLL